MPRLLSIDSRVPTLHGVLIPREAIKEQTRICSTVEQARKYARRITKDAQLKAQKLESQAMREGFQSGLIESLNAIYNALAESGQLRQQIEHALKETVRTSLETALRQPGLELQLLEGWLNAGPIVSTELEIILPRHAENQIEAMKRRIEQVAGLVPVISIGEGDNVVIQSGEQVYEFSPERTKVEMNELVHNCFQRLEVKRQCAQWSAQIVQKWLSEIEQHFSGYGGDQFDDEMQFDDDLDEFDSESTLNYFRT